MYALTKIYKSKAMAVNAIRMTATNKGWKVLSTDEAAKYVYPHAEGYEVANAEINIALGFVTEAEAAVAELDLKPTKAELAMEQAREDVWGKDGKGNTKIMKALQAPSKLEESKKAAKKAKKESKDVSPLTFPGCKPTRCETKNGARRPLRGKTLLVWETTEMLAAGPNGCPTLKEVYEELCRLEPGFNKTTAGIQFYACRAYNGWDKK